MTILDYMMNALSVRELHEIPGVLMEVLLDHNKLKRLIANMSGCYSYLDYCRNLKRKQQIERTICKTIRLKVLWIS